MQLRMGNGSQADSQGVVKMYEFGAPSCTQQGSQRVLLGPGLPPAWPRLLLGFIHKREASELLY